MAEEGRQRGRPDWKELRRIFESVSALPEERRESALDAACGADPALRAAVLDLLHSDREAAPSFLDPVAPEELAEHFDQQWADRLLGTRIGAYRLRSLLGVGGMGMVFEAIQDDPRRVVALKLLRPGAVSEQAFARFREESTLLGRLHHPAVLQVIEAGLHEDTEGVVPWFAMVAIPGAHDLLRFARERRLTEESRLRLFLEICDGVYHGHMRGVIHCDLKPSNLLVDEEGRAHIIDFGVARLTAGKGEFEGQLPYVAGGTWCYMAPEQLDAEPPDLRADVYALGVVLYELLCGRAPLDFTGVTSNEERARRVRETPPVPPREVVPELAPDLEWILLRALAKQPQERYPSVKELADDLGRYRRELPVDASPGGRLYRAGKFLRRNRWAVSAALVLSLTAISGAVGIFTSYRKAAEEGRRASSLYRYLRDMLAEPFLEVADGDEVRYVDVVDRAAGQVDERFADVPLVRGELHILYGNIYGGLWKLDRSLEHMRAGFELRRAALSEDDPEMVRILSDLADVLIRAGRHAEAEQILQQALSNERIAMKKRARLVLLVNLTTLYLDSMEFERAEPVAERAFELARSGLPPDGPLRMTAESNWAAILEYGRADHEAAARLLERIVSRDDRSRRDRHPDLMRARVNLAVVYGRTGRLEDCAALLEEALAEERRKLAPGHALTLTTLLNLAQVRESLGAPEEAERLRSERLELMRGSLAADAPALMVAVRLHGAWLVRRGRAREALQLWQEELEQHEAGAGKSEPALLKLRWETARLLLQLENTAEAVPALTAVLADHEALPPSAEREEDSEVIRFSLGRALQLEGRPEEAEPHLARARAWIEEHQPDATGEALDVRLWHGRCLMELERKEEARRCLRAVALLLADREGDPRRERVRRWLEELEGEG